VVFGLFWAAAAFLSRQKSLSAMCLHLPCLRCFLFVFVFSCFYCLAHAQPADSAAVAREVDSLIQLSRELTGRREFEKALEVNEVAEKVALGRFGRESAAYGSCCNNHGRVLYQKEDYAEVEKWYLKAISIREKVLGNEHPDYARSLNSLGILYKVMGNYEKAEQLYLEAKTIREKVLGKEHPEYGHSLNNLGNLYSDMGNLEKAEPLYLEAKAISGKVLGKEHPDYGQHLNNLAGLYMDMGNYQKAEPLWLEAKAINERTLGREHPDYAESLNNLAELYLEMGNYPKAEPLYLEAKAIREKVLGKEHLDYAKILTSLAVLYWKMGNFEKAEPLYIEAKAINERKLGKEHPDYAGSVINLALLHMEIGNYEKAEPLYLEAKEIFEIKLNQREHPYYMNCLENLGILYQRMGNYEKAEPLYLEAKASREKGLGKQHPYYAASLLNLANLYWNMGAFPKVEPLCLEAKAIQEKELGKQHPDYAITLQHLAGLYMKIGTHEKAEPLFQEAKAIFEKVLGKEHPKYASNLNNLAELYEGQKRFSESEPLVREAATLESKRLSKSATFLSENELDKYTATFQKNSADRSAWLIARPPSQRGSLPALTFDQTLFYKGFLLTATNQIKQLALSDSVTTEKFNLLKSYQRRLAAEHARPIAERKNVPELEEKANDLEKDLARSVAGYGGAMRQVKWQEVQQALKPGEAAIEFVHYKYYGKKETDSTMYAALVLRPGDEQPGFVPLCEARQLQSHIEAQRLISLNNLYVYLREGTTSLYGLLWSPLEPLLEGVSTIYYSPSGELHRLSLGAIGGPSDKVLGDRYHLHLLMSTRQLVSPSPFTTPKGGTAIVFGGIQYDADSTAIHAANNRLGFMAQDTSGSYIGYRDRNRGDFEGTWEYLDSTRAESSNISRTLEEVGITTTLLQGVEATEEAFKQIGTSGPSPKILHLATHGYFFPDPAPQLPKGGVAAEPVFKMSEHPLIRSGLILAGANHAWRTGHPYQGAEDGILTAYEVSQMNLSNTELVVLSACQTGLGDIKGNEGVYGLQRAFRIAGVKYLLMSLWKVPDGPTSELMTNFYSYWLKDKMPLEDAFKRAQSEMKAKHEDPEIWAGFVLIKG